MTAIYVKLSIHHATSKSKVLDQQNQGNGKPARAPSLIGGSFPRKFEEENHDQGVALSLEFI
jgi:hypothetical protein